MADEETAAQTVAYSLELTPDGPGLMKRGDKVIIDGITGTVVDVRPCADEEITLDDKKAEAAQSVPCPKCLAPAPCCKTRQALDGEAGKDAR